MKPFEIQILNHVVTNVWLGKFSSAEYISHTSVALTPPPFQTSLPGGNRVFPLPISYRYGSCVGKVMDEDTMMTSTTALQTLHRATVLLINTVPSPTVTD